MKDNMNARGNWMIWTGLVLLLLGVGSFFGLRLPGMGYYGYSSYLFVLAGLVGVVFIIVSLVKSRRQKDEGSNKVYKQDKAPFNMKMHYLFYIVGVIFIFASVWYFAREFIAELPDSIKLTLLIVGVVIAFIVAEFMRWGEI